MKTQWIENQQGAPDDMTICHDVEFPIQEVSKKMKELNNESILGNFLNKLRELRGIEEVMGFSRYKITFQKGRVFSNSEVKESVEALLCQEFENVY